jgi:hypothetical protein
MLKTSAFSGPVSWIERGLPERMLKGERGAALESSYRQTGIGYLHPP